VFVVDLDAWLVVDTIITGTGPHDLVVDPVREMLYAANALEASVSVIDLGQDRPTRFKEVARIGLREPFRR
jgi:DNA-binding beta-propeller fold protein YncE